jgi:hypothetical protein
MTSRRQNEIDRPKGGSEGAHHVESLTSVPIRCCRIHRVAMMGVGVAGIIAGSTIEGDGGTMISIAGGVVGLIGLFRYLR